MPHAEQRIWPYIFRTRDIREFAIEWERGSVAQWDKRSRRARDIRLNHRVKRREGLYSSGPR